MSDADPNELLLDELLKTLDCHWAALPDKPEETASNSVRALWLRARGDPQSVRRARQAPLPVLELEDVRRLRELIDRRHTGVPLAHLTGRQNFLGLELEAGPEALVPRQETEILATAALGLLHGLVLERGAARVLDLCAGAGNLATTLAHYEPGCQVWAADLSPDALQLARRNAERHQLENRVRFLAGDLFAPFAGEEFHHCFDLIVCNPPYISTAKVGELPAETGQHEPRLAFDGGAFGLSVIGRLIQESPRYLKPASWLCFELGRGQGDYLARSLEKNPAYAEVRRLLDNRSEVRALAARTRTEFPGNP
jgi:release factor glutamine methyltransferase